MEESKSSEPPPSGAASPAPRRPHDGDSPPPEKAPEPRGINWGSIALLMLIPLGFVAMVAVGIWTVETPPTPLKLPASPPDTSGVAAGEPEAGEPEAGEPEAGGLGRGDSGVTADD